MTYDSLRFHNSKELTFLTLFSAIEGNINLKERDEKLGSSSSPTLKKGN